MNGLSNTKKWQGIIWISFVIYMLILLILGFLLFNFANIINNSETKRIEQITQNIESNITLDETQMQTYFDNLIEQEKLDIVILTRDSTVYSSLPIVDFDVIKEMINNQSVSYRRAYNLQANGKTYQIYLLMYKDYEARTYMLLVPISVLVMIECLLLIGMFFLMRKKILSPLSVLKRQIDKLKAYDFNELIVDDKERSLLIEALQDFSSDLNEKMNLFENQYTNLEYQLQQNNEMGIYKMQLIQSLVHDLKTPLTIENLLGEQLLNMKLAKKAQEKVVEIQSIDASLVENINEILTLIASDDIQLDETENLNAIEIIREILRLLQPLLQEKQVKLEIDCARSVLMNVNRIEIKQVVHNIMLNACQYVNKFGEFIVTAYEKEQYFILEVYNDVENNQDIDFDAVFNLFYTQKKHSTSSGVGMFVIKNMVEKMHGEVVFEPVKNGVQLRVRIPLNYH